MNLVDNWELITDEELKQYKEDGFFETDYYDEGKYQLVKKISDSRFKIIDNGFNMNKDIMDIDVDNYTIGKLEELVSGYYESLEELIRLSEDNWMQITAEIIAEQY